MSRSHSTTARGNMVRMNARAIVVAVVTTVLLGSSLSASEAKQGHRKYPPRQQACVVVDQYTWTEFEENLNSTWRERTVTVTVRRCRGYAPGEVSDSYAYGPWRPSAG